MGALSQLRVYYPSSSRSHRAGLDSSWLVDKLRSSHLISHVGGLKEFFKAQSDEVREALKCYCCPDSAGEVKKPFEVCATEYLHSLAKHNTEQPDASIAPDGRVEEIDTDTEPITEASDEPMLKRARTGDIPIRTDEM